MILRPLGVSEPGCLERVGDGLENLPSVSLSSWFAVESPLLRCENSEEDGMSLNGSVEGEREGLEWGRSQEQHTIPG